MRRCHPLRLVWTQVLDVDDRATCNSREADDEHDRYDKHTQFRRPTRKHKGYAKRNENDRETDDNQIAPASLINCVPDALIGERRAETDTVPPVGGDDTAHERDAGPDED
jgi:hypothetical protein